MNRQDYLTAAADCVCKSREEQYGSPEDSYVDAIGYMACAGEIAGKENKG